MARQTVTNDLRHETRDRITRARLEYLRAQGRYRDLVLWQLGQPESWQPEDTNTVYQSRVVRMQPRAEPSQADLKAACDESADPIPQPIIDYILKQHPRKRGPKAPTRSGDDHVLKFDDQVLEFYARAYLAALDAQQADLGPDTRAVKRRTAQRTAKKFGVSIRTIHTILASRQILKSTSK